MLVVGLYMLFSLVWLFGPSPNGCLTHGPPSDPSGIVRGELTWRWIPLTAECTYTVDDHGHPIGPPRAGAATITGRSAGHLIPWFMTGLAVVGIAGFAVAWMPWVRLRDEDAPEKSERP